MRHLIPYFLSASALFAATAPNLPLYFEPNQGQADSRVDFLARGNGLNSYLSGREAVFSVHGSPIRMRLIGASAAKPEAIDRLPGISSYFRGSDSSKWRTGVPQFGKVQYRSVYPGIDLVYYGNQGNLEYDFQVSPGADPRKILVRYDGATRLEIASNGDLMLTTKTGEIRQKRPVVYQDLNGTRIQIAAAYRLTGRGTVGLAVGEYDHGQPLVVDPVLQYSTYFGGPGWDKGAGVRVDSTGNLYIFADLAYPQSDSNPFSSSADTGGEYGFATEAAVIKFSPSQNAILLVAHVGSTGSNVLYGTAIDPSGAMYLAGAAYSNDIPLVNPIFTTGPTGPLPNPSLFFSFLTKIAADGKSIVYSTYFSGTSGMDLILGIAIDANQNAYITGNAHSDDFPVLNDLYPPGYPNQAFLAEISASGALIFSTMYPMVTASCVALDQAGGVYIGGLGQPNLFPTVNSIQPSGSPADGIAAAVKFSADGKTVIYSTMFGGIHTAAGLGGSTIQACAVDPQGNLWVTGIASSPDLTLMNPLQSQFGGGEDAFVAGISAQGNALLFSTYLGGQGIDTPSGLALDSAGNIYVTGATASTDFPVVNSVGTSIPKSPSVSNPEWGFLTAYSSGGKSILYSTLIGGSLQDYASGIDVDTSGNVYVTGWTSSPDLPVTKGAYQPTFGGTSDAFLMTIGSVGTLSPLAITATPQTLSFVATVNSSSPAPQTVALTAPAGATIAASVSTASGGNWLSASVSGTTLVVSANSMGLASADYTGTIQLTSGTATLNISVTLHVIPPPAVLLSYSPNPWPLAPITGTAPILTITGTGFVKGASATVYLGAQSTPPSILILEGLVNVIDANTVQFYPGVGSLTPLTFAVTVTNPNAAESNPLTIQVGNPSPQITAVQNAASQSQGGANQPVAPGEIVTITGVDFGSPIGVSAPPSSSPITQLGDTQVFFDGVAAAVTYVSNNQINAIAPYSFSANSTNLTVQYLGVASSATTLAVVPSMSGLFTSNAAGSGQASALNQDGTTNSSSNPAAAGSTITLYATGTGALNPQSVSVSQGSSIQPALPISVTIGGQPATVVSVYTGALGVLVVNAQIPSSAQPGNAVPVTIQAGTSQSQQGTTMAIQ